MIAEASGEKSRLTSLILCEQFLQNQWQLPVDSIPGQRVLIGWRVTPAADGEPPLVVARVLMAVLCRYATLNVPMAIRQPFAAGLLPRRWQLHRHFEWVPASNPDEALERVFDAPMFSWSQQGQVAILSPPGTAFPLGEAHLALAHDTQMFARLADAGALGVLLPGVDGAVAGLYLFASELMTLVKAELDAEVRKAGGRCTVVGEEAFADLLREQT